jgi:uroporphyrinogen III methyltransferase/synthase
VTVYLVGAGPGDPGLITVRGATLLGRCDVVVHDRLSARALLDLAPPGAERINVGKQPGRPSIPQHEINKLLVERGLTGATVVRLKGGDPYVFARGGEEAAALSEAGVAYEVVPGISAAIAVPASGGIPVTRRYSSTSLTIVTGHEDPSKGEGSVDWEAIARVGGTVVVLMGAERIALIAERLQSGGLSAETPVAAIRWGTRPDQVTIRSTLGAIGATGVDAPSTIVIGDVAAERLDWFERRPLFGVRVVNPRAREQASELTTKLSELGAEVIELASIAIRDPSDGGAALASAVARVSDFDWVVLTSANGARRFLAEVGDARSLATVQVAAIGPGTAAVLQEHFLRADLVPPSYVAESLLEAFPAGPGRVLLPRARVARDVLPHGLAAKGWEVEVVEAYQTITPPADEATLGAVADAHVIAFTASSTVTRFLEIAGLDRVPACVATIGPITAATAREAGLDVSVVAAEHSLEGLVAAIVGTVGHSDDQAPVRPEQH